MTHFQHSNQNIHQKKELELSRSLLMSLKSISVALSGDRNIGCKAALLESEPMLAGTTNEELRLFQILLVSAFSDLVGHAQSMSHST